ncbi:T-cell surface glycoprotein CD3 delta chain-like [Cololabis saira]|uniref:T-cell surface glycoprotein CD3 delta chain-like n=1 Tax=Cololabis saira TaxID=129043 RepID=UPI002AD53765|nr:T-cell surface glycoprotein CD3 delta chain-like [Cololabis saira]
MRACEKLSLFKLEEAAAKTPDGTCFLLNVSFSCTAIKDVKVEHISNKIRLSCSEGNISLKIDGPGTKTLDLPYRDENSGEYTCVKWGQKIYVKFRSCDNCVELDMTSLVGMAIGQVVATSVVGVAVYILVSQAQTGRVAPKQKNSNKQHHGPNETSHRPTNDHYQPLRRDAQKRDEYDELQPKRRYN